MAKFVCDVGKGSIGMSGMKESAFATYSMPSVQEIQKQAAEQHGYMPHVFVPHILFTHKNEEKTREMLQEENVRLKENIEVLFCDIQHFSTSDLIVRLKQELDRSKKNKDSDEDSNDKGSSKK